MCCRVVIVKTLEDIIDWAEALDFGVEPDLTGYQPSYNVAPDQRLPMLFDDGRSRLVMARWGIPSAADFRTGRGGSLFNARVETLLEKPSFKSLVRANRCVVLCDGYYEWKREGNAKIPFFIHALDSGILPLAGLWTESTTGGVRERHFTVVTRVPRGDLAFIHDRMPMILNPRDVARWVGVTGDGSALAPTAFANNDSPLRWCTVSDCVNSPRNDSPKCVEPMDRQFTDDLFGF